MPPSIHGMGMTGAPSSQKDKDNTHVWASYRLKDVLKKAIVNKKRENECLHMHVLFCNNPFYELFKPFKNIIGPFFVKSKLPVAASMIIQYNFIKQHRTRNTLGH